jgi:Zn-dependent peptidase ImmA (M78 family)
MTSTYYDYKSEISALGSCIANAYLATNGTSYPIEPELIAMKFFGLRIDPKSQLYSGVGVISTLDSTQSVLSIDESIYMRDASQPQARQAIAHEIGHIIYDSNQIRAYAPQNADEAYNLHVRMKRGNNIEARANMFAGALLAPRCELFSQVGKLLAKNIEDVQLSNPTMTMERLVEALSGSKIARYFGVTDEVIKWRLSEKNENFYGILGVKADTQLWEVDVKKMLTTLDGESQTPSPSLTDRIRRVVPVELLKLIDGV